MAERYTFGVDRQLVTNIAVDGSVWSQDNIDAINSSLTDSINESYVTTMEDTRYFSVLDTSNEVSLGNLNLTLTNPKLEVEETNADTEAFISAEDIIEQEQEQDELNDQQVIVYTVEGSDELYGIQVVQDEDGNLQKYQFQFRKNKDGQLEAIPETVQLLPMEEENSIDTEPEEDSAEEIVNQHHMQIFVQEDNSDEHILPDNHTLEEQENDEQEEMTYTENIEEESVDVKPGILTLQNVKQEIQERQSEFSLEEAIEEENAETFSENIDEDEANTRDFDSSAQDIQEDTVDHIIEYDDHLDHNSVGSEESAVLNAPMSNEIHLNYVEKNTIVEPVYIKETHAINDIITEDFEHVDINSETEETQIEETRTEIQEEIDDFNNESEINLNDSDADDYHIVEGVHVTGDADSGNEVPTDSVQKPQSVSTDVTNILRRTLNTSKDLKSKKDNKDNRLYLYVVQHPEKENVDSLSLDMSNLCKPVKTNPRSILKSSHAMFQAKNDNETLQHQEEKMNKRFARCKEAMQARNFHNFINKTTIPQAPIRKNRLPRKQKIKPVERMDEEIVVQEVMVSSNGFVEAVGFNKENMEVTEYVELTDSDEDYEPRRINKKKKKLKKKIEITISDDSDVSPDAIIELDESDDEPDQQKEQEISKNSENTKSESSNSPMKRRRGRPPKNSTNNSNESQSFSALKKGRIEHLEKPEIPCPKCDKTFPSQNSLKTHLQHHNLQSSLRNALPEKYKCSDCQASFKNSVLLKKHSCLKKTTCSFCKKQFPNETTLNVHKRIHVKEQMRRSTIIAQVSPKVLKPKPSLDVARTSTKFQCLQCKMCGKVCSSKQILIVHMKSHKEYNCPTCTSKFKSQLVLEKHLRENCVKVPKNKRSPNTSSTDSAVELPRTPLKVKCDQCLMQFFTYKALLKHQVIKHDLDIPDKDALLKEERKKLYKEKPVFGGIPPSEKLRKAFIDLKRQLELIK